MAPLQFLVEPGGKAELAKRGKFSAPALFLAMNFCDEWIHCFFPVANLYFSRVLLGHLAVFEESDLVADGHLFHALRRYWMI
jgi:hypothetical protein